MNRFQKSANRSAVLRRRSIAARRLFVLLLATIVGQVGPRAAGADDGAPVELTRRFGPFQPQPDTVIWKTPDGHDCGPEALARGCVSPAYISPPWLFWGWGGYFGYGYGYGYGWGNRWGWGYPLGGCGYSGIPGYPNVWPYGGYFGPNSTLYPGGGPWPY